MFDVLANVKRVTSPCCTASRRPCLHHVKLGEALVDQPQDFLGLEDAEMLRAYRAGNRTPAVLADLRRRGLHADIGEARPTDWEPSSPQAVKKPGFAFTPPAYFSSPSGDSSSSPHRNASSELVERGESSVLVWSGAVMMLIGLYFLVSPGGGEVLGQEIVNIQKLTIGETFTISGAVLLAAALRPRR